MKKIAAIGLAAMMAVGATVAGSGGASASSYWSPRPMHGPFPMMRYRHAQPRFYFSTPFFSFRSAPRFYPSPRFVVSKHARWCMSRYRTYDFATDTYHPAIGVTAVCVSPWWTYQ